MVIIKKYNKQKDLGEGIDTQFKKYQLQNKTFLKLSTKRKNNFLDRGKGTLASLLPLAAVSLSPLAVQAQTPCNTTNGSVATSGVACGLPAIGTTVDVDGGGIDFVIGPVAGGTVLRVFSPGMTFSGETSGAFVYFNPIADGATITAADVTTVPRSGCGGACTGPACGLTFISYGFIDYDNGLGGWDALGTGILGFLKDDKLGFVEIIHDDANDSATIGEFGIADATTATIPSITVGTCGSFPVELSVFKGEIIDQSIHLLWETASEQNNEGFEIQRSTDGRNFHKIGWVEGAGNSVQSINYRFEDRDIKGNETYYYRLKQMDYDGRSENSAVLALVYTTEGATNIKDFAPNPVTENHTDLKIVSPQAQKASVSVYDAMGKILFEKKTNLIKGLHTIRLDLTDAQSGTHFVRINLENGESQFKKLIISK